MTHLFNYDSLYSLCTLHIIELQEHVTVICPIVISKIQLSRLQSEEDEESNHQTEETHGFGKGESKNSVAKKIC